MVLAYVMIMKSMNSDYQNSADVTILANQIVHIGVPLLNHIGGSYINNGQISYQGDITNNGIMNCGACLSGSNYLNDYDDIQQVIDGTETIQWYDVILDNSAGALLENELQVINSFQFTDGLLETDRSDPNDFLHFGSGAIHTGASSTRYVDGYVGKTGSGSFTFPVGGGGNYYPVTLIASEPTDFYKVAYVNAAPSTAGYNNSTYDIIYLEAVGNTGYWEINGAGSATIELAWDASMNLSSIVSSVDTLAVVGWDGSQWIHLGNTGTSGDLSAGRISSNPIDPSAYSAFGLGKASPNAFPVEWLDFSVELIGQEAFLQWQTASEINSAFFNIERSTDGLHYQSIAQVPAAGMSSDILTYTYTDQEISLQSANQFYYRLRQEDINGQFDYSEVQELHIAEPPSQISMHIFPNPAHEQVSVRYALKGALKIGEVNLYNQSGQTLFQVDIREHGEIKIPVGMLSSGVYHVVISNEDARISKKVVVK